MLLSLVGDPLLALSRRSRIQDRSLSLKLDINGPTVDRNANVDRHTIVFCFVLLHEEPDRQNVGIHSISGYHLHISTSLCPKLPTLDGDTDRAHDS